ncbi:hypothetical protein ZWY2020_032501 [Hordeum vulgare]|nr:hypothetical protein ZWY2020_032501 [Hordeum vulgare]
MSAWLLGWFDAASDDERALMIQAVYGLWLARNNARDGRSIVKPAEIVASIKIQLTDWKTCHETKASTREPKPVQKWEPPANEWVKINSDGAVSKQGTKGGGGAVFRDHNGGFLMGMCQSFPNISDPEAVEILACKSALHVAVDKNYERVHVELDSKEVVRQINQSSNNLSPLGHWVQEIKELLRSRLEAKVTWVHRSGNGAAHKFAKVAVGDNRSQVWVGVPPDFLLSILSDDIPCAN